MNIFIEREDLSNLPFTTMCIRESLRLHAPVQAVTRTYTRDMELPGHRTVPAGESGGDFLFYIHSAKE